MTITVDARVNQKFVEDMEFDTLEKAIEFCKDNGDDGGFIYVNAKPHTQVYHNYFTDEIVVDTL